MQKVFFVLALLIFQNAKAQIAIIKDPEGFSNVRQTASSQSKVIDTLSNDQLVFIYAEEAEGNWLPLDYQKGNRTRSGYIHKSRIVLLSRLTQFVATIQNDSLLKLQHEGLQVLMKRGRFVSKGRQLMYEKHQGEQQYVKSIDGKFPWGTDGNIPRIEYKFIQFKSGKQTLNFERMSFEDLFEPNFNMTRACIDTSTQKIYLEAINSDGAGAYSVAWTIKNGKIISRDTFIPF